MAKSTSTKSSKSKKAVTPMTEDGKYALYEPTAPREAYKKGDVVFFTKVRNWLDKGAFTEAYGRVVNIELFDNEVPYMEISFDDGSVKKMNKVDLGKDIRRFLLEVK
jgi:hypothetical protein